MSNKLSDAIGKYLEDAFGNEQTERLRFKYCLVTSSVDKGREIHVTYQIEKKGEDPDQCGTCILPVVLKAENSNASNCIDFSMHLVVLPKMKQIYEDNLERCGNSSSDANQSLLRKDVNNPDKSSNSDDDMYIPQFSLQYNYCDDNILVLENFTKFQCVKRSEMCFDKAEAVIKKLAQFHAISMVYLKEHPANGIVFQTPPLLAKDDVEKRMHAAIKAVEEIFPQFEEICTKMRKNADSFHQRITDLLEKRRCQFKVIALGDLSMQNIIFDGKCGRYSLFKNFESCFIGSCGYDLNFFFNACVSLKVLALHRYDLLRVYHQHLTQILKCFDDCFVPSLQTILDEVRDLELFGFYVLLCKMPFCDEESDFRKGYVMEKSVVKTFAFEEDYERVLHQEDIQEILKYGLDRFNDLRLWDDNTNDNVIKKEKQEDAYGFVMLERQTI
ncbi:PREDICTED: uncharacterized protein LOC108360505 [Rhagoletis zephyria]|uniref:uncharacterized protein LOC108360505 n=1 Tax=Rhagoletis zephyria TaxID=28612 RepID=UPI0008118D49|nr:PREDICTED: uncharacterized protein LOC108360505 [Rhagoletis zephyria]